MSFEREDHMGINEDEGRVTALASLVLDLNKKFGKKRTLKVLKENPDLYKDIINIKEDNRAILDIVRSWDSKNFKDVLLKLRLTQFQQNILSFIQQNTNKISLDDLEKEFRRSGVDIRTGSMIGGSIAGISKKCKSLKIPVIVKIFKPAKGCYSYSLLPEIYEYLKSNPESFDK